MRILIAEDDPVIADGLVHGLRKSGAIVDHVDNGAEANDVLKRQQFDLVVLDIGLPKLNGLDVLRRLRKRKCSTPVLILTARNELEDRVAGLDAGADDYLCKPFAFAELEARIRALVRRNSGFPAGIEIGPLVFSQTTRSAYVDNQELDLSAREIALLEILMLRAGRVVCKEQLIEQLCGWDEDVSANAIEVYIHRLRKKLEPSGIQIITLRGLGYSLRKSATDDGASLSG
jgi:two-component system OmpR family response regulator